MTQTNQDTVVVLSIHSNALPPSSGIRDRINQWFQENFNTDAGLFWVNAEKHFKCKFVHNSNELQGGDPVCWLEFATAEDKTHFLLTVL